MAELRRITIRDTEWINRDDLCRIVEEAEGKPIDPKLLLEVLRKPVPDWAEFVTLEEFAERDW